MESLEKYRRDRDRRSFEQIIETHQALVASVCRRVLRDPHDVEDLVQETFLRLAGHIGSVNGSLTSWLTSTARAARRSS